MPEPGEVGERVEQEREWRRRVLHRVAELVQTLLDESCARQQVYEGQASREAYDREAGRLRAMAAYLQRDTSK
jgi:hypothetical protein